jgi:hypothetical protein
MLKANEASIEWSPDKKRWHVVIQVGAEVIKRWVGDGQVSGDDALRALAVATARDEGYEMDPGNVSVVK